MKKSAAVVYYTLERLSAVSELSLPANGIVGSVGIRDVKRHVKDTLIDAGFRTLHHRLFIRRHSNGRYCEMVVRVTEEKRY